MRVMSRSRWRRLRRSARGYLTRQKDELDVTWQPCLEVAIVEVFHLKGQAEGLGIEAVGALEVPNHKDDSEVLDLRIQHGFLSSMPAGTRAHWELPRAVDL